jgi:hypothetical protein
VAGLQRSTIYWKKLNILFIYCKYFFILCLYFSRFWTKSFHQNMCECMAIYPYCVCEIGLNLCCFRTCLIEMIIEIFPHTNPSQLTFCLLLLHVTGKFLNSCSLYLKFSRLTIHLFICCCRICFDVRYYNQKFLYLATTTGLDDIKKIAAA